ncbi:MAG: hypothetical protein IJU76_05955 [Desulfovibrionaceae bacterium]|nr:hypothetical protein [Desulfovibrionaceae bacterium]
MYSTNDGMIDAITIRGARVHNLKNVTVSVPLHKLVGIAGVSGSGKSSLALGILYAEGSRRYLESLSAYTRRRMTQAPVAQVDEVLHVPAALALHQRPGIPGIRSTFGTATELLNAIRLLFSRLASHVCPNGHHVPPSLAPAAEQEICCPVCGARFMGPSAEELSFNSQGACPDCGGTGTVRRVDPTTLVPDDSLTIDEGAVLPWQTLMWSLMKDIARELGVRTDVPFRDLTAKEKDIVFHGPAVKHHMIYQNKTSGASGEMDFTYFNAIYTVENALSKVKDEKGMKRVQKFLKEEVCSACAGSRLSEAARAPTICGLGLDAVCRFPLHELLDWVAQVPGSLPEAMRPMAQSIVTAFNDTAKRLIDLGLTYLSLDRPQTTLSNGERQRVQLARAVRNRTTGVLYVLDEPSIGLHPSNIQGLHAVLRDLLADGNSIVLVDHDTSVLREADWLIEMGPESGVKGGEVVAEGSVSDLERNPKSRIGPYLSGAEEILVRKPAESENVFDFGRILLSTKQLYTVHPAELVIPKGRLTVVTGVSGSGKTTLILESLLPALQALFDGTPFPPHIVACDAAGLRHAKLIDASPIGTNVRSTVATYVQVHDELRKLFARTKDAKEKGYKAGDFSYNTGRLRCMTCDGTGAITLDVQFLPDVTIPCPTCRGSRYSQEADKIVYEKKGVSFSLPSLLGRTIEDARSACHSLPTVAKKLDVLCDLGLGYLSLGEDTPGLSGGEAQRLKLASEMGKGQGDTLFVFDEPTIGLHPADVRGLLHVFQTLLEQGATVLVIEHDLDVIKNADYIVDLGPGGGADGGRIVACGQVDAIRAAKESVTGRFL